MAVTPLQRDVCRLLAERRRTSGESYVAGGVALTVALEAQRLSRDLDIFHDTTEAVARSWDADRRILEAAGLGVDALNERPGFVQASVNRNGATLMIEWVRDSAYRFFPLVEHPQFGLALHPFDLATNKVLALIGRSESRDWIDAIECDRALQPVGYLSWAACGKDPGFTPAGILAHVARTTHYSQREIDSLAFDGETPSARDLSQYWHAALERAQAIVALLPIDRAGAAVLDATGNLFRGGPDELREAIAAESIQFHEGSIRGAWPSVR